MEIIEEIFDSIPNYLWLDKEFISELGQILKDGGSQEID